MAGTEGAVYRRQQMARQLPEHDQDPSKCHELTPAEVKQMQEYVRKYKDEALGVGDVMLPEEMALVQAGADVGARDTAGAGRGGPAGRAAAGAGAANGLSAGLGQAGGAMGTAATAGAIRIPGAGSSQQNFVRTVSSSIIYKFMRNNSCITHFMSL